MRFQSYIAAVLIAAIGPSCLALPTDRLDSALCPRGSGSKSPSPPSPKGKSPAHGSQSVRLFGASIRPSAGKEKETSGHHTHTVRLFGANIHPSAGKEKETPGHSAHSVRLSGVSLKRPAPPAHDAQSTRLFGVDLKRPRSSPAPLTHSGAAHLPSHSGGKQPGQLGHLVANLRPTKQYIYAPRPPGLPRAPRESWWKKAGGEPNRAKGSGPRNPDYITRKYKKALKELHNSMTHASKHDQHPPKGGGGGAGPGSPGAGASSAIARRGSGSGSPSPSRHEETGLLGDIVRQGQKKPATSHSTGLLQDIVHQAYAKPSSSVHSSHLAHADPQGHPAQPSHSFQHLAQAHGGHQVHPIRPSVPQAHQTQFTAQQAHAKQLTANPAPWTTASVQPSRASRPKQKTTPAQPSSDLQSHPTPPAPEGGRLGHLVAGLLPAGRQKNRKRPSASQGSGGATGPKSPQGGGEKPAKVPRGKWWSRPNSAPPMQYGTSKQYQSQKQIRERHKTLRAQGEHLDGHPSGHQQHPPRGPGSPGPGSHAVSKRSVDDALVVRGSGSRSPSPAGGSHHGAGSTGLLGDIVRQGQTRRPAPAPTGLLQDIVHQAQARPASHLHPGQAAAIHSTSHPSHALHVHPQAHPTYQSPMTQAHPSQHPHASHQADTDTQGHSPSQEHQFRRLGQLVAGLRPAGSKPYKRPARSAGSDGATGSEAAKKTRGPWWNRKNSGPNKPKGTAKDYETQRRWRERDKIRKAQAKQLGQHPAGHQQHPPKGGGPGSPGAGSQAVRKRGPTDSNLACESSASEFAGFYCSEWQ